ncbi:MAG: Hpt domain-containing protein, partial [Symbiobacteriaceae bacterium]|nr:Hpt domain-containing protein [Symbiobacteriaceae bacterium]
SQQDQQIADSAFLDHLRLRFIKDNRRRYGEITNAITAGDYRLAHRLTHSLKTNAGMIGETALQEAAASIEEVLAKESINPEKWQMELLGVELTEVFLKLQPLLDTANNNDEPEYTDLTTILALIARLETMLDNINPECIELLGEIRRIAGTEELIRQIEDYEFETAAYTLSGIKGRLIQDYGRE